jgi:hypothetical protein
MLSNLIPLDGGLGAPDGEGDDAVIDPDPPQPERRITSAITGASGTIEHRKLPRCRFWPMIVRVVPSLGVTSRPTSAVAAHGD